MGPTRPRPACPFCHKQDLIWAFADLGLLRATSTVVVRGWVAVKFATLGREIERTAWWEWPNIENLAHQPRKNGMWSLTKVRLVTKLNAQ